MEKALGKTAKSVFVLGLSIFLNGYLPGLTPTYESQALAEGEILAVTSKSIVSPSDELVLGAQLLAQFQQPRVALVIGNSAYEDAALRNPVNDATAVKNALESLGFEVTFLTDQDWHSMDRAIEDFSEQLQPNGVALFYYAGHGVQVDGENYLIPVNAQLRRERHVNREAISLSNILEMMEESETAVNILIIDACRNNPFYRQWRSNSGRGLAEIISPPEGTIISFATEPGSVAEDGDGFHSPYTSALLQHIETSNLDIGLMFRRVRGTVSSSTDGFQRPRTDVALNDIFILNPSSITSSGTPLQPTESLTLAEETSSAQGETSALGTSSSSISTLGDIDLSRNPIIFAAEGNDIEAMYEQLNAYLAEGDWQRADGQTWELVRQIGNRRDHSYDRLEHSEYLSFSCEDLREINRLWIGHSNQHFGYSVQLHVLYENNVTTEAFSNRGDSYRRVARDLNWPTNQRVNSSRTQEPGIYSGNRINFEISSPRGHLPLTGWRFDRAGSTVLLIRAEICGLQPTSPSSDLISNS
jgi:hypothetical protein